jgi:hypothetical protein
MYMQICIFLQSSSSSSFQLLAYFRVFGTTNLRVVDGSVLQQKYVSINDVTCRMLGLLAGDRIKEDWKLNRPHYSADGYDDPEQNRV